MSIFQGMLGSQAANTYINGDPELDASYDGNTLVRLQMLKSDLDTGERKIRSLLSVSETLDALKPNSTDARDLARAMLATALMDVNGDMTMAVAGVAGLESEHADVGNEALSTIKEYVVQVIEWIQKKWKEFSRYVKSFLNKYFGDVENLKSTWTSIRDTAKEKQLGYTLDKGKFEFEKGADAFYTEDTLVDGSKLSEGISEYLNLAEGISESLIVSDVPNFMIDDIIGADKISLTKPDLTDGLDMGRVEVTLKKTPPAKTPERLGKVEKCSSPLLGRVRVYLSTPVDKDLSPSELIRGVRFSIDDLQEEQKVKTKANMDLMTAAEVEVLAEAHIELLDSIIGIKRSNRLDKLKDGLDKASKSLTKWTKNAPDADAPSAERAAYREAVKIATEVFASTRKMLINFPLDFCSQAKMVSSTHKVLANKSLSAHKKD